MIPKIRLLALLFIASAVPATAEYGGDDRSGERLSITLTNRLTSTIEREFRRCTRLERVYRYDCYRFTYTRAAAVVAGKPAYAPAAEAIDLVRARLDRIVATNRDPAQPAIRRGGQTFVAVRADSLAGSKDDLTRALDEAQTLLLRADAAARRVDFQRIAAAVDSNKVLLRSALMLLLKRLA